MYSELCHFLKNKSLWKSIFKDGELYTALVFGIISYFMFAMFPSLLIGIKNHFSDILTVVSIVFGFAMSALLFYIQSIYTWSDDPKVIIVANKIIDWHIWTLMCLLMLIIYICLLWILSSNAIAIWLLDSRLDMLVINRLLYSVLIYQIFYSGFQILNHILTIWWSFNRREKLIKK